MKKVVIGVGIGCGALLLLAVIGIGGAYYWGKQKLGGTLVAGQRMQEQEQALEKLDTQFPFTAPPEGQVMKLDEARLDAYLAIREKALPLYAAFEEKGKEIEAKHKTPGQKPSVTAVFEAASLLSGLVADTRAVYLEGLKQQQMSPTEFQSITSAVYMSTMMGVADAAQKATKEGREALEKQLAELDQKLAGDSLAGEERTQVEQLRSALQDQVDAMRDAEAQQHGPSDAQKAVVAANLELLAKRKERIDKAANPAFDGFMLAGATFSPPANYSASPAE